MTGLSRGTTVVGIIYSNYNRTNAMYPKRKDHSPYPNRHWLYILLEYSYKQGWQNGPGGVADRLGLEVTKQADLPNTPSPLTASTTTFDGSFLPHAHKLWLKELAELNMDLIYRTCDVFHKEMSWLNELA